MALRPPGPLRTLLSAVRGGGRLPWLKRLTEQYGDVVVFTTPGAPPFAVLNHPDYVRDVLVTNHRLFHEGVGLERAKLLLGEGLLTSEEGFHVRRRRLLLPAFHRERIAGTDHVLPAGTTVLISQYFLHRDARFWSDPERFVPERWLAEGTRAETLRYSYFPFGAGPRICIGEQFAWMELTIVLATIAQRWRLRVATDQKVALQPIITLRPKYGMRMSVEPRMGAAARARGASAFDIQTGVGYVPQSPCRRSTTPGASE